MEVCKKDARKGVGIGVGVEGTQREKELLVQLGYKGRFARFSDPHPPKTTTKNTTTKNAQKTTTNHTHKNNNGNNNNPTTTSSSVPRDKCKMNPGVRGRSFRFAIPFSFPSLLLSLRVTCIRPHYSRCSSLGCPTYLIAPSCLGQRFFYIFFIVMLQLKRNKKENRFAPPPPPPPPNPPKKKQQKNNNHTHKSTLWHTLCQYKYEIPYINISTNLRYHR